MERTTGICLAFGLLCILNASCAPSALQSLVVSSTEPSKESSSNEKKETTPSVPKIYGLKVETNVTNRFATTLVTSKVKNSAESAQEATFSVVLPETAYISEFVMEIGGKSYKAYIKEKEEAKNIYNQAVSSGQSAAHVVANARDSNRFTVSVNIEPESKATFFLTYEELLQRQNGQYDIVINIHPGQPVKDLDVQVNINETRPLKFVKAPSLRSGNEISKNDEKLDPKAQIDIFNATAAKVKFNPDINRQKQLALNLGSKEDNGLAGQFIVQYDVERNGQGGEVLVSDGYFVHFFAPSDLTPLKKRVIFVLDTSGSMYGTRIVQLKEAMKSILGQLNPGDTFNIVDFDSFVRVWDIPTAEVVFTGYPNYYYYPTTTEKNSEKNVTEKALPGAFEVNEANIKQAQKVIEKLHANGGTDIQSAIKLGLELVNKASAEESKTNQPILVFLTDGLAAGDENEIIAKISERNIRHIPIFTLSLGDEADRAFLEKISLRNQGFARHIYEAADASLQLQAFYKDISSPLLSNVQFKYVSKPVSKLTKTDFPILFHGGEIAVCGLWNVNGNPEPINIEIEPEYDQSAKIPQVDPGFAVTGWGWNGPIELKPVIENPVGSLEKHWAYLTTKQLLADRDAADNKTEYTKKALDIALKYSFVTSVSSLVVVKPNDTKAETGTEDASKQASPALNIFSTSMGYPVQQSLFEDPSQDIIDFRVEQDEDEVIVSTPAISKSTTIAADSLTLTKLKVFLPWLVSHLNQNGTLQLPTGSFKLEDDNPTITDHIPCPKTPLNSTGECVQLALCDDVYPHLIDFEAYVKYFCPLAEYAGVCCPETKKTTTNATSQSP